MSLGFQGEDWLAAHGGDPVQQIVMAGKGECPEGGGDGWCQVLPGWCPDDASKMRSLLVIGLGDKSIGSLLNFRKRQ